MTLRSKTVLIVIVTMCFLIGVVFSLADSILRQRSEMLEEQIVRDNVSLVRNALSNEIAGIEKFTMDWSAWDETYEFVKTRAEKYILTNLSHDELLK